MPLVMNDSLTQIARAAIGRAEHDRPPPRVVISEDCYRCCLVCCAARPAARAHLGPNQVDHLVSESYGSFPAPRPRLQVAPVTPTVASCSYAFRPHYGASNRCLTVLLLF